MKDTKLKWAHAAYRLGQGSRVYKFHLSEAEDNLATSIERLTQAKMSKLPEFLDTAIDDLLIQLAVDLDAIRKIRSDAK